MSTSKKARLSSPAEEEKNVVVGGMVILKSQNCTK